MKKDERPGYFYGAFGGFLSYFLLKRAFSPLYPLKTLSLVTGVSIMNGYTYNSRHNYEQTANMINAKISTKINQMMN